MGCYMKKTKMSWRIIVVSLKTVMESLRFNFSELKMPIKINTQFKNMYLNLNTLKLTQVFQMEYVQIPRSNVWSQ